MNNQLPKTYNSRQGFTLIELMVVVAIIAILAVVALGIFTGAQGAARDGRRRTELGAIAKNIESTKDPTTGFYKYTAALSVADYPAITADGNGVAVPKDPATYAYCILGSTTSTPPANAAAYTTACPGSYVLLQTSIAPGTIATTDISDASILSWKVCAQMERTTAPFCIPSLTK